MFILGRADSNAPQNAVIAVIAALSTLCAITVLCRLYTRLRISRNAGLDDALLATSLVLLFVFNFYVFCELSESMKYLQDGLSQTRLSSLLRWQLASVITYNISIVTTRVSILLQYLRFLTGFKSTLACWTMMAVSILYACGVVIATSVRCFKHDEHSMDVIFQNQCQGEKSLWIVSAVTNILVDILILSIPVPAIINLKITIKQKLALIFVFTIGGLVCLATVFRLKALVQLTNDPNPTGAKSVQTIIWAHIELSSSIICASLPGMKPFFKACCGSQRKPLRSNEIVELKRVNSERVTMKQNVDVEKGLRVEITEISLPSPVFSPRRTATDNQSNVNR